VACAALSVRGHDDVDREGGAPHERGMARAQRGG